MSPSRADGLVMVFINDLGLLAFSDVTLSCLYQMKHLEVQRGKALRKVLSCSRLHEDVLCYGLSWTNFFSLVLYYSPTPSGPLCVCVVGVFFKVEFT